MFKFPLSSMKREFYFTPSSTIGMKCHAFLGLGGGGLGLGVGRANSAGVVSLPTAGGSSERGGYSVSKAAVDTL